MVGTLLYICALKSKERTRLRYVNAHTDKACSTEFSTVLVVQLQANLLNIHVKHLSLKAISEEDFATVFRLSSPFLTELPQNAGLRINRFQIWIAFEKTFYCSDNKEKGSLSKTSFTFYLVIKETCYC